MLAEILRSLVRIRLEGSMFFFFLPLRTVAERFNNSEKIFDITIIIVSCCYTFLSSTALTLVLNYSSYNFNIIVSPGNLFFEYFHRC